MYPTATFEPGQIFTIAPAMTLAGAHLATRLEDVLLVAATGIEHLSAVVPVEVADRERVMAPPGLSDHTMRGRFRVTAAAGTGRVDAQEDRCRHCRREQPVRAGAPRTRVASPA